MSHEHSIHEHSIHQPSIPGIRPDGLFNPIPAINP